MGEFAGRWVKNYDGHDESGADHVPDGEHRQCDEGVTARFQSGEKYEHTYSALLAHRQVRALPPADSWTIKTTAVKDRLIESTKPLTGSPRTGTGRFGNWLENLVD
jgi:isoleucyl-tRNA synthetase